MSGLRVERRKKMEKAVLALFAAVGSIWPSPPRMPKPLRLSISLIASQTTLFLRHPTAAVSPCLPYSSLISKPSKLVISASISPTIDNSSAKSTRALSPDQNYLSGSTRTVTMLFAIAIVSKKLFADIFFNLSVQLKEPLLSAAGSTFFAAMKDVPMESLNTPFTVVAAGMAKWLDLYSRVLIFTAPICN